jgi:hypothetical protein
MVLSERTLIGAITVLESGHIEVRRDHYIVRDDIVVAGPLYHRHVLRPGDELSAEDPRVAAVAAATWSVPRSHHRDPRTSGNGGPLAAVPPPNPAFE